VIVTISGKVTGSFLGLTHLSFYTHYSKVVFSNEVTENESSRHTMIKAVRSYRAFTYALPSLSLGGSANFGQLGRPEDPEAIAVHDQVVLGSCGLLHTVLLSKNGTVYSFGKAAGGRLGNGNDIDDCFEPHACFKFDDSQLPIALSSGAMHNCLIDRDGVLYGWGYDSVRFERQTPNGLD
jgi:alpha-tubulin suppressor-like RCC1 family protein